MTSRPFWIRLAAAGLGAVLLSWAAVATHGAVRPRVDSPHGKLREECSTCHGAQSWKITKISPKFDHSKYGIKLEGAHAAANCTACHTSLEFAKAPARCASCHEDPHRGEMGMDCARCHGARSFTDRGPMVRAHQLSAFPLTGSHAGVDCESCHPSTSQGHMQFVGTSLQCQSCHMEQYRTAKDPDHVAASYPLECQSCHSTSSWNGATFNHDATAFRLTGAHRTTACASCHGDNVYAGKPTTCISCHASDYAAAAPPHTPSGFPSAACASCHNTTSFAGATFNHDATAFPLTGAHRSVACSGCHGDGVYAGKSTACISCHSSDYAAAAPPHTPSGFPSAACASCHTTTSFAGATFNHDATAFPLTGAHRSVACSGCHGDGVYAGKPTACASCHQNDFDTATPNHSAAGFSTAACASCHTTTTWTGALFSAHDASYFRIYSGRHNGRWSNDCATCHTSPTNFAVFTCLSCHPHDSQTETDNQHAGRSGYSYDSAACYRCHSRV